jgi:hypothetical protein
MNAILQQITKIARLPKNKNWAKARYACLLTENLEMSGDLHIGALRIPRLIQSTGALLQRIAGGDLMKVCPPGFRELEFLVYFFRYFSIAFNPLAATYFCG